MSLMFFGKKNSLENMNLACIKDQIASQYLKGKGIEFGALNNPVKVDDIAAKVLYVDRLTKKQALVLFPELLEIAESIIDPDLLIDINTDDLRSLKDYKFDFFIANHCIEHLVNPLGFLQNVSRIMKPGSLFLLTVPDKEFTFDQRRELTTNQHLWKDYQNDTKTICNEHLKDFLQNKDVVDKPHQAIVEYFQKNNLPLSYYNGNKLPINPVTRKRLYNFHRERSIHVHVWNTESFNSFFDWANQKLNMGFIKMDTHAENSTPGEVVYLLQKNI